LRLAVLSDIHGNLPALDAVLLDIAKRNVDGIIHLGDLVGYFPHSNEVVARIRAEGIDGVVGNYDLAVCHPDPEEAVAKYLKPGISEKRKQVYYWTRQNTSDATKEYLSKNSAGIYVEEGDRTFLFTHGSPEKVNEYLLPEVSDERLSVLFDKSGADVLVVGHTHQPMAREVGGNLLLNPGSVGKPKDSDPRSSYMIIDTENGFEALHIRVTFDVESVARDCVLSGLPF
jgi:putative phosphoesterase